MPRRNQPGRADRPLRGEASEAIPLAKRLADELVARLGSARRGEAKALRRLLERVERPPHRSDVQAALCEAAVACHLWRKGCELEVEVPTHSGRTADFLVRHAGFRFALHVKRWSLRREGEVVLRVPASVRRLERIRRPYLATLRWPTDRSRRDAFLENVTRFLQHGSVGDEFVFRDGAGEVCGGARILAPWPGDRIVLALGLAGALDEELPRVQRHLRKAHGQFMPGMPNVILLCGGDSSAEHLVETALLGSHVERWDLFPPRGHRVAHGRATDGFWSAGRYADSLAVAWAPWHADSGLGPLRLWLRNPTMLTELRAVLAD